ncbi:DUF6218 family protein [Kutzneria chonburiensis]|uniref:DUF6218 family protein n=1 Tax=Kutzneria chonburiensis TaxID=1483604 RepID=A0ABV6MM72_9PSEU|nr:DUF6218 family protein [Kutzneria chonburiensis]
MTEVLGDNAVVVAEPVALTAPGSAVVALGPGRTEIWHVGPDGAPTGAWACSSADLLGDPALARRALVLLENRAITARDPQDVPAFLTLLTTAAGLDLGPWWAGQVFSPLDSFRETLARRHEVAKRWIRDFDQVPTTFEGLRQLSGLHPATSPNAVRGAALTVTRLLRWQVGLWLETGDRAPLPPSWLAAVLTAEARGR